jgi:hypothetical protein
MELSQKQKQQLNSINTAIQHEYDEYYSDDSDEEEDPTIPDWNIPNWKGNATDVVKCTGCVRRIMKDGDKRGCEECDEYWNMPELEEMNYTKCGGCVTHTSMDGTTRGCEECDEYWNMPDLEGKMDLYDKPDDPYLAERLYMQRELNGELE